MFRNKTMLRCAKNVRLASVTPTLASSGSKWLLLALSDSFWLSPFLFLALSGFHSGSPWLSFPLFGLLWPSQTHYCSLISRIQSLIGSQGPCLALSAAATLTHFLPLCSSVFCLVDTKYFEFCKIVNTVYSPGTKCIFWVSSRPARWRQLQLGVAEL